MADAEIHFFPHAIMRVRYRTSLHGTCRQALNYAEYNVLLSMRYRAYGDPRPNAWRTYFRGWKSFVYDMKRLGQGESRNAWIGKLGWMIGGTKGIVKYRVPPV
jgi:hypothetical protein